jgi:hypothetical protein
MPSAMVWAGCSIGIPTATDAGTKIFIKLVIRDDPLLSPQPLHLMQKSAAPITVRGNS